MNTGELSVELRMQFLEWMKREHNDLNPESALAASLLLAWVEGYRQCLKALKALEIPASIR